MLPVREYGLGWDSATELPALVLRLANGGKLTFRLTLAVVEHMRNTLEAMVGCVGAVEKPAGLLN